jgi:hypothetical protein
VNGDSYLLLYTCTVSILGPFRGDCWWEHKFSPILATIYATAVLSRIPFFGVGCRLHELLNAGYISSPRHHTAEWLSDGRCLRC